MPKQSDVVLTFAWQIFGPTITVVIVVVSGLLVCGGAVLAFDKLTNRPPR